MIKELIQKNRSYRRFDQNTSIDENTLHELIDLARLSPSAANLQPLKFALSCDSKRNALIFDHVAWAGYLTDWSGPSPNERPTGYILILHDTTICQSVDCDHGIAAQSILLGAVDQGLGGCMIGSIKRKELHAKLNLPNHLNILLIIALGKPAETVILEDTAPNGSIKYYRDSNDTHHVPKRPLEELIVTIS